MAAVSASAPAPSMKPRRLGLESDGLDGPQQEHPRKRGIRKSVIRSLPDFVCCWLQHSDVENRDRRRVGLESDVLDGPQQEHPRKRGIRKSVIRSLPDFVCCWLQPSAVEN